MAEETKKGRVGGADDLDVFVYFWRCFLTFLAFFLGERERRRRREKDGERETDRNLNLSLLRPSVRRETFHYVAVKYFPPRGEKCGGSRGPDLPAYVTYLPACVCLLAHPPLGASDVR